MKLARIVLASAAIALLAACDSNPVAPSDKPSAPRPRQNVIISDTTSIDTNVNVDGLDGTTDLQVIPCVPVITTVTVGGITSTITVCEGRTGHMGSGN